MTVTTTAAGGGGSVPTTLVSGWYWIRAVASPNYHSYLQAKPTRTPSKAYLDSPSTAGQFKIEDGQLVHLTGSSSLYLNVENPADKTQRKLETWFATTKNTYGTFAFQGDTLTWSTPDINRPNLAAWLVCENQEVFINTGAYLYQTPAGCYDQTVSEKKLLLEPSFTKLLRYTLTEAQPQTFRPSPYQIDSFRNPHNSISSHTRQAPRTKLCSRLLSMHGSLRSSFPAPSQGFS